jgi:hypothetical protein
MPGIVNHLKCPEKTLLRDKNSLGKLVHFQKEKKQYFELHTEGNINMIKQKDPSTRAQ